ncbi:MAG: efflux RND transporter permease subunit [Candidatus Solibacter usitatus]|nr:efflux RND transporter permease subunit [Candidatus Solibacter usitatus]
MWLVLAALRRPITIVVSVFTVMLLAFLAVRRMPVDIFPKVGAPAIYVAQPYGGMDPSQMEGFLTYYYEYHFLYITGIEHVESKSIQGAALMKLVFHEGTEMNQAMAEVVGYVNRSRAFMPPGAVPPFITRFDAGSIPVGQLVFTSATHSPGEMQNIALNTVRPLFATLEGVSAPPPFGGNQRAIIVRLSPDKMRQYRISPEEAINAVNKASAVFPSGNVRTGDLTRIANTNVVVGGNLKELEDAPVRTGSGPAVFLRDIAVVESGTDILTGYAHVNGKRTVYMQVTKRADASTVAVLNRVKAAIPSFLNVVPPGVNVTLEFDQSGYVLSAIKSLVNEAGLGAVLTALMVLLFLRDWRSAIVVILTIPSALLAAVLCLWITGQTINIMTLGGLALAVGVLVDEATVEIENIHSHMAAGVSRARAVMDACRKTAVPRLLSMLCILAVFVPSFFMTGAGKQLFVPLSMAVGFAMVSSYILSSTLVPVLSTWIMRSRGKRDEHSGILHSIYSGYLNMAVKARWILAPVYLIVCGVVLYTLYPSIGVEMFPLTNANNQFQIRFKAPVGTRIERTELIALKALDLIKSEVGANNVKISTAFIGVQPASYPINTVYLWTSGPQEIVMKCALHNGVPPMAAVKEKLRARFQRELEGVQISFEAGDIISQVMGMGSPTPIEVAVQGPALPANRAHAMKVLAEMKKIPSLRDVQIAQAFDYPTVDVRIDRERAGQMGLTASSVARSFVTATSSSRFIDPNYWRDPASGNGFQIQVEIPQHRMQSIDDMRQLPIMQNGESRPTLGDVADIRYGTAAGSVERYNMQRVASITANIHGKPLGDVLPEVKAAIRRAGTPAKGVSVAVRGEVPALEETVTGLSNGLLLAVAFIFLLLAANFQSVRLALVVLMTIPAVLIGAMLSMKLTGGTVNIQSFMGTIMAIGISVANSILLVTFSEMARTDSQNSVKAAVEGGRGRLRAILMTAAAMIAGMIPIAMGVGEAAEQNMPLGRAVIGGLLFATFATLTIVPAFYAIFQRDKAGSQSLDPNDSSSRYYEPA